LFDLREGPGLRMVTVLCNTVWFVMDRTSVWRVWFSVIIDGHRLHSVVDKPLNLTQFISVIRHNMTSDPLTVVGDVDDDVSVDWCLRVVMTDVVSLLDVDHLSRVFTDAYRSFDPGTTHLSATGWSKK